MAKRFFKILFKKRCFQLQLKIPNKQFFTLSTLSVTFVPEQEMRGQRPLFYYE